MAETTEAAVPGWLLAMGLCTLAAVVVGLVMAARSPRLKGQGWRLWLSPVLSVLAGVLYGLATRTAVGHGEWLSVMTLGFLTGVPFAMGAISIAFLKAAPPLQQPSVTVALTLPWASVALSVAATILTGAEGIICSIMALPLMLGAASAGGVLALALRSVSRRALGVTTIGSALLPFGAAQVEEASPPPLELRTTTNTIDIDAPTEAVWREIPRVRAIAPEELPWRASHLFGFPRPIEATLSFEGVGAVRKASFERGLVFTETVTTWKPLEELSFSIAVDPVPPEALDEHVTIGGPHFDVLDGTYRLERLTARSVRVHLTSRHRLSTRFNAYSGWWSDLVMSDIQGAILEVIQQRAEARAD